MSLFYTLTEHAKALNQQAEDCVIGRGGRLTRTRAIVLSNLLFNASDRVRVNSDLLHEIKAECLYDKYAPATDLVQRLNRIYDKINAAIAEGTLEPNETTRLPTDRPRSL